MVPGPALRLRLTLIEAAGLSLAELSLETGFSQDQLSD